MKSNIKKIILSILILSLCIGCKPATKISTSEITADITSSSEQYEFKDKNFEKSIRKNLLIEHEDITRNDLEKVTSLVLTKSDFKTLEDILALPNLSELELNNISSESYNALNSLDNLSSLQIISTDIDSLDYFSNLDNLYELKLINTSIKNVDLIKNMENLCFLTLRGNKIQSLDFFKDVKFKSETLDFSLDEPLIDDYTPLYFIKDLYSFSTTSYCEILNDLYDSNILKNHIFDDYNLEAMVRMKSKNYLDELTEEDLEKIESLSIWDASPLTWSSNPNYTQGKSIIIRNLNGIDRLENLDFLELSRVQAPSLAPLFSLKKLTSLSIENSDIYDLEPFNNIINLEELSLVNCAIEDLSPIKNAKNLKQVFLNGNNIKKIPNAIKNLVYSDLLFLDNNPFENLNDKVYFCQNSTILNKSDYNSLIQSDFTKYVTVLRLGNNITDFEKIDKFENLFSLHLEATETHSIENFENLIHLKNIECLELKNINLSIDDLNIISKMKSLKSIKLENSGIKQLVFLEPLCNLEKLSLKSNNIEDITSLSQLKKLTKLDISNNPVNSFSKLSPINNLNMLIARNANLSSMDILNKLPNIVYLDLGNNHITNLHSINSSEISPYLHHIKLDSNPLSSVDGFEVLTNLSELDLSYTSISDLNFKSEMAINTISFKGNQLNNIDSKMLPFLHSIILSESSISDISKLNDLPVLRLVLDNMNTSFDFDSLQRLKGLSDLSLKYNNLESLEFLNHPNLSNLHGLDLSHNKLTSMGSISYTLPLTDLSLYDNLIASEKELDNVPNYTNLCIDKNPVKVDFMHSNKKLVPLEEALLYIEGTIQLDE